jgi:hypothetical protein
MRSAVMILAIAAVTAACSDFAQAELDIPKTGVFNIDGDDVISFDPIPWVSPSLGASVLLWPFATDDLYAGRGEQYNLAEAQFENGSISITDYGTIEGDLGIRVNNNSAATRTFEPSVLTLDFVEESFDVYLPEFTFEWRTDMFF